MREAAAEQEKKRPNRKKRRRIIRHLIVLVIVLAILGGAGFILLRKLQADYRVTYDPYTATVGSITNSLSFSGSMQLINNTTYTAGGEAKVREIYAAEGDRVAEGDRLVRLSDGTTVTADFAGTVNRVFVEKGDEVRNNDSLVQVTDFDHMRVSFRVGENNIRDVNPGEAVKIKIASVNANFDATIKSIDYSSYTGNNVAYYTAVVEVDTSGIDSIYPGMQATITMTQEEAMDVVILKMDAISTAANNTAFVYVEGEDGTMQEQPITVGISNGNYAEIKAGVRDGETVYVVREKEENTFAGILSGIFGSQQVNRPSTRNSNREWNGGNMPGGGNYPGGGNFPGGGNSSGGNSSGGGSRRGQ